jgi:UDP-N-acetylglucosamine acyltransferase
MAEIHPTAIVDPGVRLSEGVRVGAYAILRGKVTVGPGTVIHEHTVVNGATVIGKDCRLGPAAYVGMDPQHMKYNGEETWLVIGDSVTVRETASVHRSFRPGIENATRLGDRCYLMGASHVGHDCLLGNDVTMANAAMLGGHVTVGDRAFMGGGSIMHQFVRVGRLAIVAGNEGINRDVPPFSAVRFDGLKAYNAIGVKRAGLPAENARAIRQAYQKLHSYRKVPDAVKAIKAEVADTPEVRELLEFIATAKRGVLPSWRYVRGAGAGEEE